MARKPSSPKPHRPLTKRNDRHLIDILVWGGDSCLVRKAALNELLKRAETHGYEIGRASHTLSDGMS